MSRRDFGTIFERTGSRKLYVRFQVGRGRPPIERPAGTTREIAKSKLRRVQHLLDQGVALEKILHQVFGDALPESITFREAVDEYLVHARLHRKASTVVGYERLLGIVNQASWTLKPLADVVAADITRWLDGRARQGLAPQTLNNGLTVCSAVFRWAQERGLVEDNPVRRIRRIPNKGRGREVYLTA